MNQSAAIPAPAATLVIFGAMGDLAKRLLVPSLVNLVRDGLIGDGFSLIGVSHHDLDDEALREGLGSYLAHKGDADKAAWEALRGRIHYQQGSFEDPSTYASLARRIEGNAAFHLATAPSFFGTIVDALADAGLLAETAGFRRVLIEKPFGRDLGSAKALNRQILSRVPESQVYRIDHFLGKETVQNVLAARFANTVLEAVWSNRWIDHVEITAAETVSVGSRGKFYDETGALRDMIPNHLFQLVAMVGMEPPNSLEAEAIRDEKAKLLAAVRGPEPERVELEAARGFYAGGLAGGEEVTDYHAEDQVVPGSRTETYAAIKFHVDTWRWAGVPFYLRTGKALKSRDSEIVITFKPVPLPLLRDADGLPPPPNKLVLQIQPDEGVSLELCVKRPEPILRVDQASLDFRYANFFPVGQRTGYETLLYDALIGDQTLFQRADMVEAGWAAVQSVLEAWEKTGSPEGYKAGSDGPSSAEALMTRDGRQWHELS